ncbi:MAG: hypothetical protein RLN88_12435 [Ekhidna sp.]|uniref:hypothetical protein n=1 Tax=Ekhidna sp. TaxID=2608089 RepID=UPI0032ED8DF0
MEITISKLILVISHASLTLGIVLTVRSLYGNFSGVEYGIMDRSLGVSFLLALYTQTLLEGWIFFTSTYRYEESLIAMGHFALIILATILTQAGRFISKKASDHSVKFRFRSIYDGIATGLLLYGYILMP